jgi:hypothetical protein
LRILREWWIAKGKYSRKVLMILLYGMWASYNDLYVR